MASQLALLAIQCKKAEAVDLKSPVHAYIAGTYSEQQARDAEDDLAAVQEERNEVSGLTGSLFSLTTTLQKYYCALSMMETRFPISREKGHVHVGFKWFDAFRPSRALEQHSIHFEKAAVLFNLAAVLTQQALSHDLATDTGLKDAARKFQEAAGVWALLRDGPSLKVEQPRPVDISPECAAMLERLCLAQAQEATFEKARADGKKQAILARLAKQVAAYYQDVRGMLGAPPLASHLDRSWACHVGVKAVLYEAEAQSQAAAGLHAEQEIAPEIARIKEAQRLLETVRRDVKGASKELQDSFRLLNESLGARLLQADRENATVYLQRIPAFGDLPPLQPAALVKPLPPALDSARDGLFTSVIPDGSAKALSKYTEMVDSLIREQMGALEGASDDARVKLREWELPECLQALDAGTAAALPDGLRAELEQLEDNGGARHLQELQAQIGELRRVAEEELAGVERELQREAAEDAELRARHGQRWARPASVALNAQITEKVAGYRANLAAAGDSDGRLAKRLADCAPQLASLSTDAAVAQMPRLQAPMVSTGEVEPAAIVAQLRQALGAVDGLGSERAGLEEALKVEKNRDNILPRIMAASGGYDALFREEVKKYDQLKADVAENVGKQARLMEVIGANQAAYKQAFGYREWRAACEAGSAGVRQRVGLYRELRDNLGEGLRFYMSLQEALTTLRQQAGDYVLTRTMQKDDLLEGLRRAGEAEGRQQREAGEQAARDRAAASLAQLNLQSAGSQGSQGWGSGGQQAQHYPPAPAWQQGTQPPPSPPPSSGPQYGGQYGGQGSHTPPPPPPPPPQQQQQAPSQPSYGGQSYGSQHGGQQYAQQQQQQQPYHPQQQYPPPQQYYQHPPYYAAPQGQQGYGGYQQQQPPPPPYQGSYSSPPNQPQGGHGHGQGQQQGQHSQYYNPFSGPPPQPGSGPPPGGPQGSTQNPLY